VYRDFVELSKIKYYKYIMLDSTSKQNRLSIGNI